MKSMTSAFMLLVCSGSLSAQEFRFAASLDGSQEVPAVTTTALGWGTVTLSEDETQVAIKLYFSGLGTAQTLGHIHGSDTAGAQGTNTGVVINIGSQGANTGDFTLTSNVSAQQVTDLRAGRWYFNVHSGGNPSGEIRGQILPELPYHAVLLPIHEIPAVTTAPNASGIGRVVFNATNDGIVSNLTFEGLSSNQTAAHIHSSTGPGANGGVVFNIGSQGNTSGAFENQAFTTSNEQINLLRAGRMYFNVHSANNTGGEVRGQILRGAPIYARLQGNQEVPPVVSNGSGTGFIQFNASETGALASASYSGLSSNASVAHLHTGAFGVNGAVITNYSTVTTFVGSTSGFLPYAQGALSQAQVATLKAGGTYFNVHSANFSGGELRGQVDGLYSNGFDRRAFQALSSAPQQPAFLPNLKAILAPAEAPQTLIVATAKTKACHE